MLEGRARVLVVDDSVSVRNVLFRMISDEPDLVPVGVAHSGEEACASAAAKLPDIVLMDLQMPGMDGIEATRWITRHVPRSRVIGMSAADSTTAAVAMRAAGALAFVSKLDGSLKSGQPIAFAGLWERNTKVGAPLETATIITTDPNSLMSKVHDRMPVILSPEAVDVWLDPKVEDPRRLLPLLAPYDPDQMQAVPVSSYVGKVGNEGPVCIEPLADPEGELAL